MRWFSRNDFQLWLFERGVVPEETFDSFGWRLRSATFLALRGSRFELSKLLRGGFDFLILLNNFPSFKEFVEYASFPVPTCPGLANALERSNGLYLFVGKIRGSWVTEAALVATLSFELPFLLKRVDLASATGCGMDDWD